MTGAKPTVDPTQLCSDVLGLDCLTDYIAHEEEILCGTDGVTYLNKCFHVQARCKDLTIDKAHDGKCDDDDDVTPSDDVTTKVSSTTNFDKATTVSQPSTSEVRMTTTLHEFVFNEQFCNISINDPCPTILDPVCGTDLKFYQNNCEFHKVKCMDRDIELQPLSNCKDNRRS